MEDSDDNIDRLKLGEFEKDEDEDIFDSNNEPNDNILEKERPTESSNNDEIFANRFTIVENNYEEPSDLKDDSVNLSKNKESNSNNNSKTEELNKKKKQKKSKGNINFINIKVILVGDASVGKTSIIGRYLNNSFNENYKCTIQAEQQTKIIKEDEKTSIKMTIWDTVGQEKFRSITRQYYRDCQGAIVVFDLTKKISFERVKDWYNDIKNYGNDDTVILILGNKSDLTGERELSINDIKDKLKELDEEFLYYEVSAKNGNNISMAFDKLKKLIMKNIKTEEKRNKDGSIQQINKDKKSSKFSCC